MILQNQEQQLPSLVLLVLLPLKLVKLHAQFVKLEKLVEIERYLKLNVNLVHTLLSSVRPNVSHAQLVIVARMLQTGLLFVLKVTTPKLDGSNADLVPLVIIANLELRLNYVLQVNILSVVKLIALLLHLDNLLEILQRHPKNAQMAFTLCLVNLHARSALLVRCVLNLIKDLPIV